MPGITTQKKYPSGRLLNERVARVSVVERCGIPKVRSVYRLSGLASRIVYGVHNNNRTNIVRAVMERVFYATRNGVLVRTPQPAAGAFERLSEFKRLVTRGLPVLTPITYEQFVMLYSGRRRVVYTLAWQSLCAKGIHQDDARIKAFVKAEKVKLTKGEWEALLDPAPRLIQPRDPRYNVEVGRFIKPLEHIIYGAIARVWGGPTVMKGFNADQTGAHIAGMVAGMGKWVGIGADASRFDQCVSAPALSWEHSIYLSCYRADSRLELSRLLSWQLRNRGSAFSADGKVTYTVEGNRMSGDMNTALGNCLLMCAMIWAYCEEVGVPARLANNGDDCMIFMPARYESTFRGGFEGWMTDMGFHMVLEATVTEIEHVEFCQAKPVLIDGAYRMVRSPSQSLSKDAVSVLGLTTGSMLKQHLTTLGECGLALNSGVPILQSFFSALIRAGGGKRGKGTHSLYENGMHHLARGMSVLSKPVSTEARVSFWLAFGITPDDQLSREGWYDTWEFDSSLLARPFEYCLDHSIPLSLSTHLFSHC